MKYRVCLSVAGIKILLETDEPLIRNEEFVPFLTEENVADVQAGFYAVDWLPPVPERVILADRCFKIAADAQGNFQKFFYEKSRDTVHYAVSAYDSISGYIRVEYLKAYKHCVSEIKNCFFHIGFEAILLRRNKLCLHAACVETSFGGILFSGASGIGKSTQADLWCKYRMARQINGDRPILAKEDREWLAWGSPYAGSSKYHVNDFCSVFAIVLLKQAKTCSLRRLASMEAFRGVWAGVTVRSWDVAFVEEASSLTVDLVTAVPVYEFSCTQDEESVAFLEEKLRKEYNL